MPDYTLNMSACISHLRSHAFQKSTHKCATYVKNAMRAGGLPYIGGYDGGDNWKVCKQLGYIQYQPIGVNANQITSVTVDKRSPRNAVVGDICCVYGGSTVGHMCMFDGCQWISDYRQSSCIPYSTWHGATFWRWKDAPAGNFIALNSGPDMGGGGYGGMYGQMSSQEALSNAYPTHSEYATIQGTGGNIFESTDYNAITAVHLTTDPSVLYKKADTGHIRIYSTNDSTIVLDELSLPLYHQNDNWANKGVTKQQEQAIIDMNEELKKGAQTPVDSSTTNSSTNS